MRNYVAWLDLVGMVFLPCGVRLNGVVELTGEECMDSGILAVFSWSTFVALFPSSHRLSLAAAEFYPRDGAVKEPWLFHLNAEMFGSNMRERLLSMLLAARLGEGAGCMT